MKERPIPFNGEMVRAIIDGRKTQTRRVIKPQPERSHLSDEHWSWKGGEFALERYPGNSTILKHSPYSVGDLLWVKETWGVSKCQRDDEANPAWPNMINYREGSYVHGPNHGIGGLVHRWRSPRFMPRWASRITLKVEEVRVQRLQDISDGDIEAEGLWPDGSWSIPLVEQAFTNAEGVVASGGSLPMIPERYGFAEYWDSLKKEKHPWSSNPWVWAITFEVQK